MQEPINVHLSIRFFNSLCKVQIFKKYLAYFSNMRNMTQNIQNGSFDIKRGLRILRGGARGGVVHPPSWFGPNLYAKNVIDVF